MSEQPSIIERKRYPDGRVVEFECRVLRREPGAVAVRFDHVAGAATRYGVPPGSYTIGYFWEGRRYNLYRIRDPQGRRLRDRFDVLRDCRVTGDAVEYTDLFVDLVVDANGEARTEDEDELEAAVRDGLLTEAERYQALQALAEVAGSYVQAIEGAEHFWPAEQREAAGGTTKAPRTPRRRD